MSNTENIPNHFMSIETPFETKNSNNFYEEEQKQADKAINEIRLEQNYNLEKDSVQQEYQNTFSYVESLAGQKEQIAEDYNGAVRAGVDTLQEYDVQKEMPKSSPYDFKRLEEYAPVTAQAYRNNFYDSVSMQDYLPELARAEQTYKNVFHVQNYYQDVEENAAYGTADAILASVYESTNKMLRGAKSLAVSGGSNAMNSIHKTVGFIYELIDPEQAKFLESFNLQNINEEQVAQLGSWLANFWGDGDEKANLAYQDIIRTINKSLNNEYKAEDVLPEIDLTKNYAERLAKSGTVNEFIGNVAQVIPQIALAIGAGALTGGGAWAAGGAAFLNNWGMSLDSYNQDPLANKDRKELAAFLNAAAQTPLEFVGLKGIFKAFKPKSSVGIAFKDWVMGSAVEGATEYFQSYPEQIAQEFVRGKNLDEMDDVADILNILFSWNFQKDALYQGAVGAAGGGVFGSVGAIGTLQNERAKAKNLVAITSDLDFAKKYPALFKARMEEHIEHGTIPENMFVQAVKIDGLFQSVEETGITKPEIDVFLEQAGIDKADYEEALKTGGTVNLPTANIPLLLETEKGKVLLQEISASSVNETTGTQEVLTDLEKSKKASNTEEKIFTPVDEYLLEQEYNFSDEEMADYEARNAEIQQRIKEQEAFYNNEEQDLKLKTAQEIINATKNTERPYRFSEAMDMAEIIDATLENISKNSGLSKAGAYKRFAPHFIGRFATQEELDTTIQNIKTERGSVAANRFNPYAITNYRKGKAYKNELADLNKTPIEQISGVHAMIKAVGMPIRITKAVTDFSEQYNEARRRMPRLFSNTHGVPYDEWRDIAIREGYTSDLDDWGYILELIANAPTRQEAIEEQKSELLRHEEKLQDLVESNIKNIENIDPEEAYRADEELALQEEAMFDEIDDRAMQNEILDSGNNEALYQQQEEARIAEEKLQSEIAEWENVITSLEKKPRNNILMLKQTPLAMHLVGADFKELHIAPHAFDGLYPAEKTNQEHNIHPNIDKDILKKIPQALADPVAVYQDKDNNNRFIFITDITDKKGATVVIPVDFKGNTDRAEINIILSVFAKNNKKDEPSMNWFLEQAEKLVYVNRNKDKYFWQKNKRLLKNVSAKAKGVMSAGTNSLWDVSQSLKLNVKNESDLVKLKNQYPAFYQLAYHGTPHNFDKFTLDHIGSGEGAQAHGWGLYFAKNKGTSEEYRKHLATNIYLDDEVFYNGIKGKLEKSTGNSIADDALLVSHGDIDKAISDVQSDVDYGIPKAKEAITILQDIKNNNRLKSENKGQLFEVDIPENDVLLDEDKEYKEQSSKVKKLLKKVLSDKIFSEYLEDGQTLQEFAEQELIDFENGFTGGNIYDRIKDLLGSDKEASLLLNQHGIKGITYDGKQDGRCFVVFDDKAISVLEKYYQEQNEARLAEAKLQEDLQAWDRTVDKFESGELNPRQSVTMLNNTPLVLSLLGADKNLTISTNYSTLNKVLHDKHKLPASVMKQVPKAMTDPIMIFKSATVANDYVMMLDLKDEHGATVVVPVTLNYDGIGGYKVNYALSIYGKKNEKTNTPNNKWFINQIEQGNLVYQNNKKSREWLKSSGLQLPRVGLVPFNGKKQNILTDADLSRARNANPEYYQNTSPRGLIRFNPKTQEAMITVFKDKKDFSTILHETSHYFLQTLANAYQMENAPAWVKENFEKLAKEMGFDPSLPLSTETHERFARLGEAYFREGKAPREELAGAFNMFKGWLTSLYRYVSKLLGRDGLNDEIRSVFDNMLATEEQIEQAKRNREKESSIQILAKKFNLKPEQIDLLQKEKDRADKKASAIILLNKIQGLKNAEEDARKEASEIVRTSDYYNSLDTIRKNGKISFESLLGFLDEDTANSIRTKWKDYFSDSENAMSLDDAAVYFNTSAEQFINLLFNEVPAKDYIDQYVQNAKNKFEASFNADAEYMGLDNDVLNLEIELMGGQKIDLKALDTALSERADRKAGEDLDRDYERLKMSIEKKSSMLRDLLNKKEDTATKKEILKLKEQMRIMRADLKANYEKKMERDKTVRAVRKEVKSKSVPEEWRQQILQLVQKVKGLGTPSMTADMNVPSWQEFKDTKFGAEKQDLGVELAAPPIPEWLENLVEPIALSELSTADLKDLRTGIKSLAHIGRTEQTILAGQERKRVQETVNECTENMGKITQTKYLTDREKAGFIGGIVNKTRGVVALMTQMRDLFRRADGYTKEGTGANSKYITQRIHDAQVQELGLTDSFQKEFQSIWQPVAVKSNFTKEFVIEGIKLPKELIRRWGGKFSKDRVIAVALNMGNKGNLDALMKGYGWTMEDLGKIISTLSEEELFAVQKTWDMLERLRPHLEKAYREMNGVDMKLVEAQAITVTSKEGTTITLPGGYYPLQFDPELAQSIGEKEKIDNILNANAFLPTKPTVRKGMTMARTGSKKPPLLSFVSVVSRHLEDSIKYATHAVAVRDVYKIVSNAEYRDSFVSAFGTKQYDQIVPWLKACANIDREPTNELKKFAKYLTSRGSLFAMGLSLRTSWMQFTSIGSSIKVDGLGNFMNGCWMFITKPRETAKMVKEMSAYMNNRTKIYDKTVADTMRKYNPNATALRVGNHIFTRQQFESACFALTAMADMAVAVPTWLGKYNAEIKNGLTEQDAIRKADEAVIMAQGSGMTMDTTALMREKGAWEFMLMFMSFAMNWQNRQRFYFAGYKEFLKGNLSEIDHKEFFSHIALEWIMPPVLTVAMLSLQDDDYTLEEAKDDLMNEAVSYWLMGVPIIRDIYSGIGYGTKFGETAASKGIELGKQIYNDMEKLHNGKEMNYTIMKHIINFVGFNLGIPTNSFFRAGEGTYEWLEGDAGIGAIILGKPYKKK